MGVAVVMTNNEAREALRAAHAGRVRAEATLEAARAATGRAREVLAVAVRDLDALDGEERRAADELADRIRVAIEQGVAPKPVVAKASASRAELEVRRTAIERTVAEFQVREVELERGVELSCAAVANAVQNVLMAEAKHIADRWEIIDREAQMLRARLGRPAGRVWRLGGVEGPIMQAIAANDRDQLVLAEHHAIEDVWVDLASRLVRDPDARIDFAPADGVIAELRAERESHRAGVSEIVSRMQAKASAGAMQ
jgi:hypothetical protein